ncbi:hypothetical protein BN1723_020910 [Verticillium longisporum]|uniref:Uncharacterized protein n=1 Tax=Verticillium longisporum TaxID=100787 RepID=A0A0G4KJU1_VERLO|nr:hypothetical protein BN1723_020910 [Verticillium longisporum]
MCSLLRTMQSTSKSRPRQS